VIEAGGYSCRLLTAISADLSRMAETMLARWRDPYAAILTSAGDPDDPLHFSPEESTRELYSALTSGRQATVDVRLGGPLGVDRLRPRRAEAWRSGRSLRSVTMTLEAARALAEAAFLPDLDTESGATVRRAFDAAAASAERMDERIEEAVFTLQGRLRVEALQ
jgi:predicted lipoprotein